MIRAQIANATKTNNALSFFNAFFARTMPVFKWDLSHYANGDENSDSLTIENPISICFNCVLACFKKAKSLNKRCLCQSSFLFSSLFTAAEKSIKNLHQIEIG